MIIEELPAPNIPLLRKAVEWAEAEAAKIGTNEQCLWDQGTWAAEADCGTAYCIAGFAVINGNPAASVVPDGFGTFDLEINGERAYWSDAGEEVLGLTYPEAEQLFSELNSITDVRRHAEAIAARAGERL